METLFVDKDGNRVSDLDIENALVATGAHKSDTLFIHSDIMFGSLVQGIKRNELLSVLFDQIKKLNVRNIIVPTFTYSFPNGEDYDVLNSRTSMGVFNEYVRKLDGRYRTDDPLLSVSVPESLQDTFGRVSYHSLGEGSALDIIHQMGNVSFLFFGAEMSECFTYVHYVEKILDVPYRFDMSFEGNVIYPDGTVKRRNQTIHTQCRGAVLPPKYEHFESEMEDRGYLKKKRIGDRYIACLSEKDAYREIRDHILNDISYFLSVPFNEADMVKEYTYSTDNGRITHC
ncbi:MAG: AAC(3) family N-acetyltransferase [Clostridiales bacterium]|nr:AAC(3) family N-acetyltransferase [Clostridiales bacterium]